MVLKKIVHILFHVFQTNLNKAVNIICKLSEWIKDFNENIAWVTQKTEEPKCNKENFTPHTHTHTHTHTHAHTHTHTHSECN